MIPIEINNRPFASDLITGLMMPDGIFEISLGKMRLNAHFTNSGASILNTLNIYVESASHPGIVFTPVTHFITSLGVGASILQSWEVDISTAPSGTHYVSFIVENPEGRQRIIKKIFVTKISFNSANHTFLAETPEGKIAVRYREITEVNKNKCCKKERIKDNDDLTYTNFFENLSYTFSLGNKKVELCPIFFLPLDLETGWVPNPPYEGQYSDLPFNDPWWKVVIAIIAFLLLVAAAIVEATSGSGSITATAGCTSTPSGVCGSGSGSSPIAAALVAGAAVVAGIAVYSDKRDLHRIGQDKTMPDKGEFTIRENMSSKIKYIDNIEFGKPFTVRVDWKYERVTRDINGIEKSYFHSEVTQNQNVHLLSKYVIDAPDIVRTYKKESFTVKASFYDEKNELYYGKQLFVKCFLVHAESEKTIDFVLQDNGKNSDKIKNDGTYTGSYFFKKNEGGRWKIYVVAQDVNNADENMTPEEAAQIIGGIVLTNQLSISFSGGSCPLVPDGDVEVIV
ncbi:hypothetical protein [Abyssalbus ytuae]|uniref:Uncharacterized protein n=1 Tax=Abyssalbus ytuae TaxID=2926907 RepID=A0A9E6ZTE8_9FLAO|nr:hypothetical protein [Abyssalbus ytuae]UOB17488.1 hypothetical protein MQE35_17345 [Abyssalbus ytuae]